MAIPTEIIQQARKSLEEFGIKNPFIQAGILGVISKETGFNLRSESSYRNTSNARLRTIFGTRLSSLSDLQLDTLKKDDSKFYDLIYGNRYGNSSPGDGFKFRGRGYNQLTFKDSYKRYGDKIGIDLVSNPDLVNKPQVALKVLASFFKDSLEQGKASGLMKSKHNVSDWKDVSDIESGTRLAVQSNAGWKTNFQNPIIQEGYKKALESASGFLESLKYLPLSIVPGLPTLPSLPSLQIVTPSNGVPSWIYWTLGGLVLAGIGGAIYYKRRKTATI